MERVSLREGIEFHGHLGPYLVLGLLAGEYALKNLRCKKYFGVDVRVWGANKKPKSCLIDGLQLSTGATYGKGNIRKLNGNLIKIEFLSRLNNTKIKLDLKKDLKDRLEQAKTHKDSELLAKKLYKTSCAKLFNSKLITKDS